MFKHLFKAILHKTEFCLDIPLTEFEKSFVLQKSLRFVANLKLKLV